MNSNQKGQLVAITDAGAAINWTDNSGLNINLQKSLIQSVSAQDDTIVQITMYSGTIYSIYFWQNETNLGATSAADLLSKIQELVSTGGGGTNYWGIVDGVLQNTDDQTATGMVYKEDDYRLIVLSRLEGNSPGMIVVDNNDILRSIVSISPEFAGMQLFNDQGDKLGSVSVNETRATIEYNGASLQLGVSGSVANYNYANLPNYQNHNAADSDSNLNIGSVYTIDNSDNLHIKTA